MLDDQQGIFEGWLVFLVYSLQILKDPSLKCEMGEAWLRYLIQEWDVDTFFDLLKSYLGRVFK